MLKRNVTRVIVILLIGVLMFSALSGCGGRHPLVGTWEAEEGWDRLEFRSNGAVVVYAFYTNCWVQADTASWRTDGNRLTISFIMSLDLTHDFSISGNTLTLTLISVGDFKSEHSHPVTYTRVR